MSQPTCEQRWQAHKDSRVDDLQRLWAAYRKGDEDGVEDLGNIYEYGLGFDYVAPNTFTDQEQGYFRYQISWGGPSDEFRFYTNHDLSCYKVEYWFLDWWDGHGCTLYNSDKALLMEIWDWFEGAGSAQAELEKAEAY